LYPRMRSTMEIWLCSWIKNMTCSNSNFIILDSPRSLKPYFSTVICKAVCVCS
jgi:hypothetical protein